MVGLHPDQRLREFQTESSLSIEKFEIINDPINSTVFYCHFFFFHTKKKVWYMCIRGFISNNFHLSAQNLSFSLYHSSYSILITEDFHILPVI